MAKREGDPRKLNALAEAVAHILAADETAGEQVEELRAAYGLEKRESILTDRP